MVLDRIRRHNPEFRTPGCSEYQGVINHLEQYYIRHTSSVKKLFKGIDEDEFLDKHPIIKAKLIETTQFVNILLMTRAMLDTYKKNPKTLLIDGETKYFDLMYKMLF